MANVEILSCVRQLLDYRWAKNGDTWIANDYDRFYLLKSGKIEVIDENGHVTYGDPYHLCLLPGGSMGRRYRCVEDMDLIWLHLRFEFHTGLSPFHCYSPPTRIPLTSALEATVFSLLDNSSASTPPAAITASSCACDLYRPFLPDDWSQLYPDSRAMERLSPVLDFMERHPDRALSLKDLAEVACLHPTYFSNLFSATFGTPALRYHMGLRMRRSQALLLNTRFTRIEDVAHASGFEDPLHFSRVFKRHTGASPSTYRKNRGVLHP